MPHTFQSLQQDLKNLGIKHDDTVLIHSSLKSIGEVEGGIETVFDALEEYLADGLLVFPTLTYSIVNDQQPIFSVTDTPSVVGAMTEIFRKRPGVVRSLHPTHSLAAKGKDAAQFVAGHEKFNSPEHRESPWGRLYDRHAKIMFIGTRTIACNTFLHSVEEWLPVPDMLTETAHDLYVIDTEGVKHHVPLHRHVGSHSQFYGLMEKPFLDAGGLTYGVFGSAKVYLLDARIAGDVTLDLLKKEPFFFTKEYQESQNKKS